MNETMHASALRSQGGAGTFGRAVYEVARKEFLQHIRTKRLLIIGSLFLATLVFLTIVVPHLIGISDLARGVESGVLANYVFLFYLSTFFIGGYFFIQLLSIVLTSDAVCSEWQNRTLFLLLSKPVSRTAFVVGKIVGSVFTIAVTVSTAFLLVYLVLVATLPGTPSGAMVLRFLGAIGILVLGAAAYASWSLFFSTLTRSTVMSLLFMLGMWIFVFPIIAQLGFFTSLGSEGVFLDRSDPRLDWSRYLSPGAAMGIASKVLVGDALVADFLDFFDTTPARNGLALVALGLHVAVPLLASIVIVRRRNFE